MTVARRQCKLYGQDLPFEHQLLFQKKIHTIKKIMIIGGSTPRSFTLYY